MGRIPDEIIQQIRDHVDVVELVGRTVSLKRSGRNYKGLCPFHGEKTPSFNVNPDRGTYYCFGCQEGGDVFSFLMKTENLTFGEAVRSLARDCGIEVPEVGGPSGVSERVFAAAEIAQAVYRRAFAAPANPAAAYLAERGLAAGDAERFGIGYAPDAWDTLVRALEAEDVPSEVGEKAGLLAARRGGGHYDRLRGRLTFPIQDARGRVIGFGGRALRADQEPKYLNTTESPVFRKREALYGMPAALAAIRANDRAVVVEGYFDRIALARAGVEEGLATCGTALTEGHAHSLRRRTRNVVLLFDGDEAGRRAVERALALLLPEGLRVRAALLPAGDDPDSLLAREGPGALREIVDRAPSALDFAIERAVAAGCDTPWAKADAVAAVAPLLARVPSGVERSEYVRRLALAVAAEPRHVEAAVRAAGRGEDARDAVPVEPRREADPKEERWVRHMARCLVELPHLGARLHPDDLAELLPRGPLGELIETIAAAAAEGRPVGIEDLAAGLSPEAARELRALAVAEEPVEERLAVRVLDDTLRTLRENAWKRENDALTRRLREPNADAKAILEEKQRLKQRWRAAIQSSNGMPQATG